MRPLTPALSRTVSKAQVWGCGRRASGAGFAPRPPAHRDARPADDDGRWARVTDTCARGVAALQRMASQTTAEEEVTVPLPIALVCLHGLTGDIPTLCAAACVNREWNKAATGTASAWSYLQGLSDKARSALTDARLVAFVARARGTLVVLDANGARLITDAGLLEALQPQSKLACVILRGCAALTAAGVLAALAGKSALRTLIVSGVQADKQLAEEQLAQLQALVPDAHKKGVYVLDVTGVCKLLTSSGTKGEDVTMCGRVCGSPGKMACDACQGGAHEFTCAVCADEIKECAFCGMCLCKLCADAVDMTQCANCHTAACDGCGDDNDAFCEACLKSYCADCSKHPGVLVECARCNTQYCATPCAKEADVFPTCDGCPDDLDVETVMMCGGCRDEEDELREEFGGLCAGDW